MFLCEKNTIRKITINIENTIDNLTVSDIQLEIKKLAFSTLTINKSCMFKWGDSMTRILHLSDLHLTTNSPTQLSDAKTKFYSLVDKIIENDLIPDIIVVSGDIINQGDTSAFTAFEILIDYALVRFGLTRDEVVIAVGNHDLIYRNTQSLREIQLDNNGKCSFYDNLCFEELGNREPVLYPFEEYLRFYRKFYNISDDVDDVKLLAYHKRIKNVNFIVINSCWGERDYISTTTVCIACQQVKYLMNEYLSGKDNELNITVLHHPCTKVCENCIHYFGSETVLKNLYYKTDLVLCGHMHSFQVGKPISEKAAYESVVGNGTIGENTTFALYCLDAFGLRMDVYTLILNNDDWKIEPYHDRKAKQFWLRPKELVRFDDDRLNKHFDVHYRIYGTSQGEEYRGEISVGHFYLKLYSIILGENYHCNLPTIFSDYVVEGSNIDQAMKQALFDRYGEIISAISRSDYSQFINYLKSLELLCFDGNGNVCITCDGIALYDKITEELK